MADGIAERHRQRRSAAFQAPLVWKVCICFVQLQQCVPYYFLFLFTHDLAAARHQWRSYYIYGELDACDKERVATNTCISIMFTSLEEAKVPIHLSLLSRTVLMSLW